jgi:hypothetical protein
MVFDLENELLPASKEMTLKVAQVCINDEETLKNLIEIAFSETKTLSWHACWVIEKIARLNKTRLTSYANLLVTTLPKLKHPSQIRPILFTLTIIEFDYEQHLELLDYCIEKLTNEKAPYNEKARALMILKRFVAFEPELKKELFPIIEQQIPFTEKPHFIKHLTNFLKL